MASSPPLPPLKSPQFSLRTLFAFVTLVALVSALSHFVSPLVLAGIIFLIVSIAAHVAGNKLGTTLRAHSSQRQAEENEHPEGVVPARREDFAPPTRLRRRQALGLIAALVTLLGAVGGGVLGVIGAYSLHRHPAPADLLVSGGAGAVLVGMVSFAVAGFVQEIGAAAWEASQTAEPVRRPPKPTATLPAPQSSRRAP
jgi:hypothetical protein